MNSAETTSDDKEEIEFRDDKRGKGLIPILFAVAMKSADNLLSSAFLLFRSSADGASVETIHKSKPDSVQPDQSTEELVNVVKTIKKFF